MEIQGGIYHLETGRVEFLGHAPTQAEVLASDFTLPPSVKGLPVRTTTDGPMPSVEALQILKDGNKRFVTGETLAGNVTNGMRKARHCWLKYAKALNLCKVWDVEHPLVEDDLTHRLQPQS